MVVVLFQSPKRLSVSPRTTVRVCMLMALSFSFFSLSFNNRIGFCEAGHFSQCSHVFLVSFLCFAIGTAQSVLAAQQQDAEYEHTPTLEETTRTASHARHARYGTRFPSCASVFLRPPMQMIQSPQPPAYQTIHMKDRPRRHALTDCFRLAQMDTLIKRHLWATNVTYRVAN